MLCGAPNDPFFSRAFLAVTGQLSFGHRRQLCITVDARPSAEVKSIPSLHTTVLLNRENRVAVMSASVPPPVRIGTRRSILAMVQAEGVRDRLQQTAPGRDFEISALRTLGDKDKSTALYSFGAKSLWTAELEELLDSGKLDVVVHCLKGAWPSPPPSHPPC